MKAKDSSIPAGKHFLPGTTAESMRAKQLEEADPKAAERLLAYIMRKKVIWTPANENGFAIFFCTL